MSDEMRLNLKLLLAYCLAASYSYYYHVCVVCNAVDMMGGGWYLQKEYEQFVLAQFGDGGCRYYIDNFPQSIPIAHVNQSDHNRVVILKKRRYVAAVSSINHSMISDEEILVSSFLVTFFFLTVNMRSISIANIKVSDFFWFFGLFVILVNVTFDAYVRDKIGLALCEMLQNVCISDRDLYVGYDPLAALLSNITTQGKWLGYHSPYHNGGYASNDLYFNNKVCWDVSNYGLLLITTPLLVCLL
jgi:hypothetical protein